VKDKPIQVLVVEDNAGDVRLLREMFSGEKAGTFEITHLLRMSEAEAHLAKGSVDITLLDMGLPDGHGLETVRRAHAAAPGVPVIILTGLDDEALAAEAMTQGAQDYLIKGQIESRALPRALRHAIERHRMQTEADLICTNQMQFKDEFLSHVSHELRSPLTAVRQFVSIILDGLAGELNSEQRQYLQIVLRNVKQLHSIINDLFEVSGVQAGKLKIELQCTSISDALDYAIDTLQGAAAAKGIILSSDIGGGKLPSVYADPARVRQILIILTDNAIKFTPQHGTVKIQTSIFEEDPSFLLLEVSDSGCGIAPDMTERIFDRLVQAADAGSADHNGLGLGLYICKDLVMRQGGKVWARSTSGQGSVFSVTFPIFSLPRLLAPAFREDRPSECPITVVVTEIGSQTGWLSNEMRSDQCRGIRELLLGILYSDLDVLLPKMDHGGPKELFFIAANTDETGGEAISKRIRKQLDSFDRLKQAGLTHSTSHRSFEKIKRHLTESKQQFLERVAIDIQELMNMEISARQVSNG
jgi:signal transduction histidine kinase